MTTLLTDLRLACRSLSKTRGFAVSAIGSLALGMTLCTTAAAVMKAYLLEELPYPASERLYSIRYAPPGQPAPAEMERLDWSSLSDVIEHPVAWDLDMFYLTGGDHSERAPGAWITRDFMEGLGIQPAIGRAFLPEEFEPGGPQVALISHELWQTRFGGDPGIVGKRFNAYVSDRPEDPEAFSIVGVMPGGVSEMSRQRVQTTYGWKPWSTTQRTVVVTISVGRRRGFVSIRSVAPFLSVRPRRTCVVRTSSLSWVDSSGRCSATASAMRLPSAASLLMWVCLRVRDVVNREGAAWYTASPPSQNRWQSRPPSPCARLRSRPFLPKAGPSRRTSHPSTRASEKRGKHSFNTGAIRCLGTPSPAFTAPIFRLPQDIFMPY